MSVLQFKAMEILPVYSNVGSSLGCSFAACVGLRLHLRLVSMIRDHESVSVASTRHRWMVSNHFLFFCVSDRYVEQ